MFAFFESRIRPTAQPGTAPPAGLLAFYWHYVRQTKGLFGRCSSPASAWR